MVTRRDFISKACVLCAAAAGITGVVSILSSCASIPVLKTSAENNKIIIPLDTILPDDKLKIIRVGKLDYDILLVKDESNRFHSLLMKCTHFDNNLTANNKGLNCTLHGSTFSLEGKAVNGPATRPLKQYKTEVTETNIIINLS